MLNKFDFQVIQKKKKNNLFWIEVTEIKRYYMFNSLRFRFLNNKYLKYNYALIKTYYLFEIVNLPSEMFYSSETEK